MGVRTTFHPLLIPPSSLLPPESQTQFSSAHFFSQLEAFAGRKNLVKFSFASRYDSCYCQNIAAKHVVIITFFIFRRHYSGKSPSVRKDRKKITSSDSLPTSLKVESFTSSDIVEKHRKSIANNSPRLPPVAMETPLWVLSFAIFIFAKRVSTPDTLALRRKAENKWLIAASIVDCVCVWVLSTFNISFMRRIWKRILWVLARNQIYFFSKSMKESLGGKLKSKPCS